MDADKEGFYDLKPLFFKLLAVRPEMLMDEQSYADKITDSMKKVIEETERRREVQMAYNKSMVSLQKPLKKN